VLHVNVEDIGRGQRSPGILYEEEDNYHRYPNHRPTPPSPQPVPLSRKRVFRLPAKAPRRSPALASKSTLAKVTRRTPAPASKRFPVDTPLVPTPQPVPQSQRGGT
ncbi:hypothetical protein ABVT39_015086, partial [Epinephelus coioides]